MLLAHSEAVRWYVSPSASSRRGERDDRVRDVVDGDDVDRRRAAGGEQRVVALGERAQRPVQDVERRGPAAVAVADDDARAHDGDRQPLVIGGDDELGLELRLLVGVAEALAEHQVVLGEGPAMQARDVRRRDVGEAAQPALEATQLREREHPPRSLDVDRARRVERELEGHRRGAVHDLRDAARDLQRAVGIQAEPGLRDVAGERSHAMKPRLVAAERAAQRLAQPLGGMRVVARAHQRVHGPVGELQVAHEQLHPDEAGRARQQHAVAPRHRHRLEVVQLPRREDAHAASASASSSSIASSMPRAIRSASSASAACA